MLVAIHIGGIVITNPGFMKEGLRIVLESMHLQDTGDSSNALQKDEKELAQITNEVLDIAGPKSPMLAKDMADPATLTANLVSGAVRGPLSEGWLHQSQWPGMLRLSHNNSQQITLLTIRMIMPKSSLEVDFRAFGLT